MSVLDQQSDEYFQAHAAQTGRVISAAAYFDDAITEFLSAYLGLTELQEDALLRPMTTTAKIDLLGRLAKLYLDPNTEKDLRPMLQEGRACLEERNSLVHGVPGQVDGKFAIISWRGKNRLDPQPEEWPVEKVCQLASRFMYLCDLVSSMAAQLNSELDGAEAK